jgi:uncharacterized protein (UPF0332 family)
MKEDEIRVLVEYRMEQARFACDDGKYLLEGQRTPQSIINRAYYAMFYAALALLQTRGKIPSKHSGVMELFDLEFVRTGLLPKELSHDFHKAFDLRQVTDYRVRPVATRDQAQALLEKAARFVQAVAQYLSTTPPPTP